jgi:YHS domain-containing protein
MIRNLFRFLIAILVVAFVRYVIAQISKVFSSSGAPPSAQAPPRAPASTSGGELHRDPICGTFVSEATSLKSSTDGATVYFCSANCRDRFLAGSGERKA